MCNKRNTTLIDPQSWRIRVDSCLTNLLWLLSNHNFDTLASCCGHGKYNLSIVYRATDGVRKELISGVEIPRSKKFYKKDKEGYYYIPEVVEVQI